MIREEHPSSVILQLPLPPDEEPGETHLPPPLGGGPASAWRVKESDHFRVRYVGDLAYAASVLETAERLYKAVEKDLGFDHLVKLEHLRFWSWNERCTITLYRDALDYARATGLPLWSPGVTDAEARSIVSHSGAERCAEPLSPAGWRGTCSARSSVGRI